MSWTSQQKRRTLPAVAHNMPALKAQWTSCVGSGTLASQPLRVTPSVGRLVDPDHQQLAKLTQAVSGISTEARRHHDARVHTCWMGSSNRYVLGPPTPVIRLSDPFFPSGELFDLEELAAMCKELNRWTFFVSSVPLNMPGGVSSPPNAMAIF